MNGLDRCARRPIGLAAIQDGLRRYVDDQAAPKAAVEVFVPVLVAVPLLCVDLVSGIGG